VKMTADEFNAQYPVGTSVVYQELRDGEGVTTKTRSEAWDLGAATPVVLVDGHINCVSIEHVIVLVKDQSQ